MVEEDTYSKALYLLKPEKAVMKLKEIFNDDTKMIEYEAVDPETYLSEK